jgi:hypothetical protein
MMIDREFLEQQALECCAADEWYELLDCLEETPDGDLIKLIESSGSVAGE